MHKLVILQLTIVVVVMEAHQRLDLLVRKPEVPQHSPCFLIADALASVLVKLLEHLLKLIFPASNHMDMWYYNEYVMFSHQVHSIWSPYCLISWYWKCIHITKIHIFSLSLQISVSNVG